MLEPVAIPLAPPVHEGLPFTGRALLAPMDGVTDASFRDLVLERLPPQALGGAFTEFVRVVDHAVPRKVLRRHLGPHRFAAPVGLQLMGSEPGPMAESTRRAAEVGAPVIDLNFGCPAKGALRGCSGSAALDDLKALERLVDACVRAQDAVPVTAKVRSGVQDPARVEEIAKAVEQGGARMLTVHYRTRLEAYCEEVDWSRIRRAVEAVSLPVCGNGSLWRPEDLQRMRDETGCDFVMVGRGALGDPWIFSGARVTPAEAADFLLDYAAVLTSKGMRKKGVSGRVKQLLRYWSAGDLLGEERQSIMEEPDPDRLLERLRDKR